MNVVVNGPRITELVIPTRSRRPVRGLPTTACSSERTCRIGQCDPVAQDVFRVSYATTNIFWPRPCSGWVVRRTGNEFYILTARHCVTQNGEINGPLPFTFADLIVTTALAPGAGITSESNGSITVHGGPPPGAGVTIWEVGNPAHEGDHAQDRAIIKVFNLDITSGRTATTSGHGLGAGGDEPDGRGIWPLGGGTLLRTQHQWCGRAAPGFWLPDHQRDQPEATHTFDSVFKVGQHKLGGDSGSPIHYMNQINGMRWLIGVTSTQATAAGGVDMRQWLQDTLGHVFLASVEKYRGSNHLVGAQQFAGGMVGLFVHGRCPRDPAAVRGGDLAAEVRQLLHR